MKDRICINTPAGKLIAYIGADPNNPAIGIALQPKGCSSEIDIAYVETKSEEILKDGENADDVFLYVYTGEEPTSYKFTKELILGGLNIDQT